MPNIIMLKQLLQNKSIIYITRDIERALGMSLDNPSYFIVSNFSQIGKELQQKYPNNILLIKSEKLLDTHELLTHETVISFVQTKEQPNILVFKPTQTIERICFEHSWILLNPSAKLSETIENKISQVEWLGELSKYLPPHSIVILEKIKWKNTPFILQFNRAHTGEGTFFIQTKKQLEKLQQKFPKRPTRITDYIESATFTSNIIVTKDNIHTGNINYQITGLYPFTDKPFATIGNDWGIVSKLLNQSQIETYNKIANEIGKQMQKSGWKGLFGIDVLIDQKTEKLYLLEINARQPASTTCESQFQQKYKQKNSVTTFEGHLFALLEYSKPFSIIPLHSGSQIVQRITEKIKTYKPPTYYKKPNFDIQLYTNTKQGKDLIRLQFEKESVIKKHNILSESGEMAMDFVMAMYYGQPWNAPRAGVLIIENNKILLIHRQKFGRDYYIIPGGTIEDDETLEQTAIREIEEETSLKCTIKKEKPIHIISRTRDEYYYIADSFIGEVKLGGPEAQVNNPKNTYTLKWIDIEKLQTIELLPKGIYDFIKKCN